MVIFRRIFENNFIGKIRWEVEVNLSRLSAQWADSINAVIESMRNQAARYVEDELATIESLLSKTRAQTDEIREMIQTLEAQVENLKEI